MKAEIDQQREEDLERYIEILPTCELFQDRLFFTLGIINLHKQLNDIPWEAEGKRAMMRRVTEERLKQGYTQQQIESKCCVPRGQFRKGFFDRTIIGCLYGF